MATKIHVVEGDLWKIVRKLRYEVYVEELGFDPPGTDHSAQTISDELDEYSTTFALLDQHGQISGTVRCTRLSDVPNKTAFIERFGAQSFVDHFGTDAIASTSRFMFSPGHRRNSDILKLVSQSIKFGLEHGVRFNFGDTNPFLLDYFERLGYRRYASPVNDPIFGFHVPIVMVIRDLEYMGEVGSLLRRYVPQDNDDVEARTWFKKEFPLLAPWRTTSVTSVQGLMGLVESFGGNCGAITSGALSELGPHSNDLLPFTSVLEFSAGDVIVHRGEVDDTLYVCLGGTLTMESGGGLRSIHPGDAFGATEAHLGGPRRTKVMADSDGVMLVFPARHLRRLVQDEAKPFGPWLGRLAAGENAA
jgi:N-acyl-L-homoserine lactone synthetase